MNRKIITHRPSYIPQFPEEQFIVPLLEKCIQEAINKYAIPNNSHSKVLDIGCGRQPFKKDFQSIGYQYFSLDVHQNVENNVDIIAEIDKPIPKQYELFNNFDFLLCTEVLEHVADWESAFINLKNLSAIGGKVLITCPHFYQLHEEPYDFWRPTPYALEYYAKKFGFNILEQIKAGDVWDVLGTVVANTRGIYPIHQLKYRDKMLLRIMRYLRKIFLQNLINRKLQTLFSMESPLYLSNIIILQKA